MAMGSVYPMHIVRRAERCTGDSGFSCFYSDAIASKEYQPLGQVSVNDPKSQLYRKIVRIPRHLRISGRRLHQALSVNYPYSI